MSIRIASSAIVQFSAAEQECLFNIMQHAYAITEVEIWGENYIRMPKEDYFALIQKGTVLVAYFDNVIAGCVHFIQRDANTFGFSLLATHQDFTKRGIGSALVQRVEEIARAANASTMLIDILRPRDFEVPTKVILRNWYEAMGYKYTHSEDFAIRIPIKAKRLLVPSNFDRYSKAL